jgi:hypothetical protein
VTTPAAEYALADLAFRLGAAQVAGLSPAERTLAAAAAAWSAAAPGARRVNIAHGLYPRDPLPPLALDRLAAYLRGSVTAAHGRVYAGGLAKFEPGEMERLPVPAPTR